METIQPRFQENDESIEQYIDYFTDLIEANEWNDSKAAAVFRAMLPRASDTRALMKGLTEAQKSSFVAINAAITESRKPLRDAKVMKLYSLQREPGQKLEDLATKVVKLVEEVYPSVAKTTKVMLERDRFLTSLNPELKAAMCNSQNNLRTVSDVKNLALAIETSSRMIVKTNNTANVHNNHSNVQSSKKWCKKCHNASHCTEECRKLAKANTTIASITIDETNAAKRQYIKLVVMKKPIMALIDTGSQISTVPAEWSVKKSSRHQITAINGSRIENMGSTRLSVIINGDSMEHDFLVTDLMTPIIGRDFLIKIKGNVRYNNWLDYSLNNQPHSCQLLLEDQIYKRQDEPNQEIEDIIEESSITYDPTTDMNAHWHPKLTTNLKQHNELHKKVSHTERVKNSRITIKEEISCSNIKWLEGAGSMSDKQFQHHLINIHRTTIQDYPTILSKTKKSCTRSSRAKYQQSLNHLMIQPGRYQKLSSQYKDPWLVSRKLSPSLYNDAKLLDEATIPSKPSGPDQGNGYQPYWQRAP